MADRAPRNEDELDARRRAVELAADMLAGRLTYFEGAVQMEGLRRALGGVDDFDPDFLPFTGIFSETDHLPLPAQRHLWSPAALERLAPQFVRTEEWAKTFAPEACQNIIARFGGHDS